MCCLAMKMETIMLFSPTLVMEPDTKGYGSCIILADEVYMTHGWFDLMPVKWEIPKAL